MTESDKEMGSDRLEQSSSSNGLQKSVLEQSSNRRATIQSMDGVYQRPNEQQENAGSINAVQEVTAKPAQQTSQLQTISSIEQTNIKQKNQTPNPAATIFAVDEITLRPQEGQQQNSMTPNQGEGTSQKTHGSKKPGSILSLGEVTLRPVDQQEQEQAQVQQKPATIYDIGDVTAMPAQNVTPGPVSELSPDQINFSINEHQNDITDEANATPQNSISIGNRIPLTAEALTERQFTSRTFQEEEDANFLNNRTLAQTPGQTTEKGKEEQPSSSEDSESEGEFDSEDWYDDIYVGMDGKDYRFKINEWCAVMSCRTKFQQTFPDEQQEVFQCIENPQEIPQTRLKYARKLSNWGIFCQRTVDGCMFRPIEGCKLFYCPDHLSYIRNRTQRDQHEPKTDLEMYGEDVEYGICKGCSDMKESNCRITTNMWFCLFFFVLTAFAFFLVPYLVYEFGGYYQEQDPAHNMNGRNSNPDQTYCTGEKFCFNQDS